MKPTICPHLGLKDDPETYQAFPSLRNCCQRARPIEPVSLEHQSTHCLCLNHVHCVVLANSLAIPLPVELQVRGDTRKRNYLGVAISLVLMTVFIVVGWRQSWFLARSASPAPTKTELISNPIVIATSIATSRIAMPNVYTNAQNTLTPTPSLIPSMSPSLTVTPIPDEHPTNIVENTQTTFPLATDTTCAPPPGWVVYIVKANDSLFYLGLQFGVTVTELQEANCMGTAVIIYTGQKLYVPNVPALTPSFIPTPTEAASPTDEFEIITDTPEPVSTDTPFPTDTQQPTNTPNPSSTPSPTNTLPPPPQPTDILPTITLTPPPTGTGLTPMACMSMKLSKFKKLSAFIVEPIVTPRNKVVMFASSFCAVLFNRSNTPLTLKRFPSISMLISLCRIWNQQPCG
jgi:LysM repeat protein